MVLDHENRELPQSNEILSKASAYFGSACVEPSSKRSRPSISART